METIKKHWLVVVCGIIIIFLVVFGWSEYAKAPLSSGDSLASATSTDSLASTPLESAPAPVVYNPFSINAADALASWSFKGAHVGNATLTAQTNADIAHLTNLIGKGEYDDYDLYNGLANNYALLGDGKTAYTHYNSAIRIHPNKGLAYVNLAHLMDGLGAYHTAADAYAKAVSVEPGMLEYHIGRLDFLTDRFATDTTRILSALTDVTKHFGDNASILAIEAEWFAEQGRYADAIKAWQTVKMLSLEGRQASIDTEIARLQAKL